MPNHLDTNHLNNARQRTSVLTGAKWLAFFASLSLLLSPGAFAQGISTHGSSASGKKPSSESRASHASAEGASTPASPTARAWRGYLQKLQHYVEKQPSVAAEKARSKAAHANVAAEEGDLNLKLTGSYSYYPNGVGTSSSGSFTNLKQRAEGRLSWGLLGFLSRRPGRIQHAKASAKQHKSEARVARLKTEKALLEEEIARWAATPERKALKRALRKASDAKSKLGLAHQSSLVQVTGATSERVTTALNLYSRIHSRLATLPRSKAESPPVPKNYSVLPLHPPQLKSIQEMAKNSARAKSYRAQSRAAEGKAQSFWGNGIDLNVYGGYISEKRKDVGKFKSGPEVGLKLTIPIGTNYADKGSAAEWTAKAKKLEAKAAIARQGRYLHQLRNQWVSDAANLKAAAAAMQRQATLLHKMKLRAEHPASGKAPEPWELDLREAKFWLSVGKVWNNRRQWVQDTLTWALYNPDYLQQASRAGNANAVNSLCAPLSSCMKAQD